MRELSQRVASRSGDAAAPPAFRTALVTGASSGIGRELARLLVAAGSAVALVSRRGEVLSALARAWATEGLPGRATPIPADLGDPQAAHEAAARAEGLLGAIELALNCAGIYYTGPVAEMPLDRFVEMAQVNYLAAVAVAKAVIPGMCAARRGTIVNVSSMAGKAPVANLAGYGASKFALACFTAALRQELAPHGIRVVGVYPGPVDTPMIRDRNGKGPAYGFKTMPILQPLAVARAILAAARRGDAEVYLPPSAAISARLSALFPSLSARVAGWLSHELPRR